MTEDLPRAYVHPFEFERWERELAAMDAKPKPILATGHPLPSAGGFFTSPAIYARAEAWYRLYFKLPRRGE